MVAALVLVGPIAFGERFVKDTPGAVIFAVVSLFFGLLVGHFMFRDDGD